VDVISNGDHCGACGHSCLGGACELSTCQPVVLAMGQSEPRGLALDDKSLFWATEKSGTVVRFPKDGGSLFKLAGSQLQPTAITTDGLNVYWVNFGAAMGGTVVSVTVDGAFQTTLATGQVDPRAIAADGLNVYWANSDAVMGMPKKGGSLSVVASGQDGPNSLVVAPSGLYWTTSPGGTVMRLPTVGKAPILLASSVSDLWGIAVFGMNAYVTSASGSSVRRVAITGGNKLETFVSGQVSPTGIAADASGVYWANSGDGTVMRAPFEGGTAQTLAINQEIPTHVATDEKAVYWVNEGSGTVMKVAK
jgi:sugar lactone lactonase YvrE